MKTPRRRRPAAFTLTEVLVVIVIIITLAALSMIGISRIRSAGDRAATITIMRQLQIANMGYATDHNGQYMPIVVKDENQNLDEWYSNATFRTYLTGDPSELEKTTGELLVAPESILDPIVVRSKKRQWDRLSASYGFNATGLSWPADHKSPPMSYRITDVANPSRTAFIVTATNYQVSHRGRNLWKNSPIEGKTTDDKIAYRHMDKAIVIYYDGSTGFITLDDMARFDREGGVGNAFWKAK
jgi:type II secretory pathway pseudopilin PulG